MFSSNSKTISMPKLTYLLLANIILLLAGIVFCNKVYALKSDETKPINIQADNATFDQQKMETVFTGDIVITRGSIEAHANKGVASQSADGNKYVTLYGTPVTFKQLQDDGKVVTGQGDRFDYDTKSNLAILTGRARVREGNNMVSGDKITYNTKTLVYTVNGLQSSGINAKKSGRVTVILDQVDKSDKK